MSIEEIYVEPSISYTDMYINSYEYDRDRTLENYRLSEDRDNFFNYQLIQ